MNTGSHTHQEARAKSKDVCTHAGTTTPSLNTRLAEILLQRMEAHSAPVKTLLEARRNTLLLKAHEDKTGQQPPSPPSPIRTPREGSAMLRSLLDELRENSAHHEDSSTDGAPTQRTEQHLFNESASLLKEIPNEPKSLRYFRSLWSRLSDEQRLQEAMAELPENAGPLNAHWLMHRALQQMNTLSPDYLGAFLGYAESLLWLERSLPPGASQKR